MHSKQKQTNIESRFQMIVDGKRPRRQIPKAILKYFEICEFH